MLYRNQSQALRFFVLFGSLVSLAGLGFAQTPTSRLPALDARAYQFTRVHDVSVTGDLSAAGVGKVLTFTQCPSGLQVGNGVRVSGGTGTAEVAAITAVSCAFAASGTITVTTTNSHTGAWTLTSATGGIDEAFVSAGAGGSVYLAGAVFDIYSTIHMSTAYSLTGMGPQASKIVPHFTALDALAVSSVGVEGFVTLSGFSIDFPSNQTLGSGISITNKDKAFVSNVFIRNPFVGIDFSATGGTVIITMNNVQIGGTVGARGIRANGSIGHGLFIDGLIVSGIAANQIGLELGAVNSGSVIKNCSFQGGADSIRVDPGTEYANESMISNCIFDSYTEAGLKMTGTAPGSGTGWTISNIRAAGVGGANVGFDIGSIYRQINISEVTGGGVGGGLVCRGCQNLNVGPNFTWSGDGTGTAANIAIDVQSELGTPSNGLVIHGSTIGFSDAGATTGNTSTIGIRISAAAHTGLRIEGNRVYGSGAILQDSSSGTGRYEHNVGIDDVIANIASGATVTAPNGYKLFNITGTTAISNILPGSGNWIGRAIDFVKFDAGTVSLTTGANIVSSAILPQYGRLTLAYDGTYWHPIPDSTTLTANLLPLADNQTLFKNFTDGTKLAKLDLSGISTGTTRTYKWLDSDGTIPLLEAINTWKVNALGSPVGYVWNSNALGESSLWFKTSAGVDTGSVGVNILGNMYLGSITNTSLQFLTNSTLAWSLDTTGTFLPETSGGYSPKIGTSSKPVFNIFTNALQIRSTGSHVASGAALTFDAGSSMNVSGSTTWPNAAAGASTTLSCPATQAIKSITVSGGGVTAVACGVP